MSGNTNKMTATFWGVRGSVPSPLTGQTIHAKLEHALLTASKHGLPRDLSPEDIKRWMSHNLNGGIGETATYGGNTTCLAVRCGEVQLIFDMGTGLRELGRAQMSEIVKKGGYTCHVFQSHLHWDHIQGMPFWKPLYLPRKLYGGKVYFHGGKSWDSKINEVLAGQMDAPVFPVNLEELKKTGPAMEFSDVWDGWEEQIHVPNGGGTIKVKARKLNHPQETFGYRVEYGGRTLVFTTDHEPYGAGVPDGLIDLVDVADAWVTDCQYTKEMYTGEGRTGPKRHGWGHSFPEYIAEAGKTSRASKIYTTHHDPEASDEIIPLIAQTVREGSGIDTVAAYEGLTFEV